MKIFNTVNSAVRVFVNKAIFTLQVLYVRFVEVVTLRMIAWTGKLVRKLLILKGKDPDFVPPPPPPPVPEHIRIEEELKNKRKELLNRFLSGPSSSCSWIHIPSKNPVLQSRKLFESKGSFRATVEEPLQVTAVEEIVEGPAEETLQVTSEELPVEELVKEQ